ncbi:MAG TPA: hypothetical protein VK945_06120 [Planococcus sp. (in: firmicutes)]|nr:hypothetical protein [Planococcus sp. (in: firmicutes)]
MCGREYASFMSRYAPFVSKYAPNPSKYAPQTTKYDSNPQNAPKPAPPKSAATRGPAAIQSLMPI